MISFDEILTALATDPHEDGESYRVVASAGAIHVAVDITGNPALLVPVSRIRERRKAHHGSVRVYTHPKLRFQFGEHTSESAAIVVQGQSTERLKSFSLFLYDLIQRLTDDDHDPLVVIDATVNEWRSLLSGRGRMSPEQELGLWGELAMLHRFDDVDRGLVAWVGPLGESVDFRGGGVALECKTSRRRDRHVVSLEQVEQTSADKTETYLVSLWVEADYSGRSLPQLVDQLDAELSDVVAFRRRLLRAGYDFEDSGLYTDVYRLQREPSYIPMAQVPRVHEVDEGVSNVRFTVSLEDCEPTSFKMTSELLARLLNGPTAHDDEHE